MYPLAKSPVIHILSGDLLGGKEVQVQLQAKALSDAGVAQEVLLLNSAFVHGHLIKQQIKCHVAAESGGFWAVLSSTRQIMRDRQPSLLVAHGYKEAVLGCLLRFIFNTPLVVVFHGKSERLSGFSGIKLRFYECLMRAIALYGADEIACVSSKLASELNLPAEQVVILQNVVSLAETEPNRGGPAALGDCSRIIMVGRLVPVKRFDLALRVLNELVNYRKKRLFLTIVGDGELRSELESLAQDLAIADNVTFLGFREDAASLIGETDLFMLTSVSEGVPTVLLEALVRGVPVVTTNVGGIGEVLSLVPDYPCKAVEFRSDENQLVSVFSDSVEQLCKQLETDGVRANESTIFRARNLFGSDNAPQSWSKIFSRYVTRD